MTPLEYVALADHCTMGVGGPARFFVEARDEAAVLAAHEWARTRRVPLRVLGGGSNLVVADEGVDALVVKIAVRGVSARLVDGVAELTAAAGEPWDELVRESVARGWAGLECLSGIPGLVGATPMQNVGAYGQEVSDSVSRVRVLDTSTGRIVAFANRECRFGYRDSLFRSGEPGRYVVLSVSYQLRPGGGATVRYVDVEKALAARGIASPTLADVRASVLAIRRSDASFAQLAHSVGFCDQSHFIRDFRVFTGTSPADFFRTATFCPSFWDAQTSLGAGDRP